MRVCVTYIDLDLHTYSVCESFEIGGRAARVGKLLCRRHVSFACCVASVQNFLTDDGRCDRTDRRHDTNEYQSSPYGCFYRGVCKHATRTAYSVYGFEGHHTYRLDLVIEGWDVATYKTMEVIIAWNLDKKPNIKVVEGMEGCSLVGFNSHSITVAGDRSGSECSLHFQAATPLSNEVLTDAKVLCAPIHVMACPPPPSSPPPAPPISPPHSPHPLMPPPFPPGYPPGEPPPPRTPPPSRPPTLPPPASPSPPPPVEPPFMWLQPGPPPAPRSPLAPESLAVRASWLSMSSMMYSSSIMMMMVACTVGCAAYCRRRMAALQEKEHKMLEAQWDDRTCGDGGARAAGATAPRKNGRTSKHDKTAKKKNGRVLIPNYDPFEGTYSEPEPHQSQ